VVGELHLTYETMQLTADPGLPLFATPAEAEAPGVADEV
jgi:hypothetical protein